MNKRQELNKAKLYRAFMNTFKSDDYLFYAVIMGELLHEDPTLMYYFIEVTCNGDDVKTMATKRALTSLFDNLELNKRDLVAANITGDKCVALKRAGQEPDSDAIHKEALKEYNEAD